MLVITIRSPWTIWMLFEWRNPMAKANIQKVMEMLDPDKCAEVYELPNIMARENFRLESSRVASFDDFMAICQGYYVHHFNRVVVEGGAPPEEFLRGQIWEILDRNSRGGIEAAYKAASRGINGGLSGVLDSIRDYFVKDQEEKYFNYTIMESVDVMDLDDIKTLMTQYLQRYGRHLDGDNLPSADYLVQKYREVLKSHAQIVRSIRTQFGR